MIKYYVVMNQDINKDKTKEDLILKYRDEKFLAALPLKNFLDIDKYFSSPPKMPKKYNAVYTYRDYNKDKIKDHIIHLFTLKGKYILSLPINNLANKKYKKLSGGNANNEKRELQNSNIQNIINDPPQPQTIITKDDTEFSQILKTGVGVGAGAELGSALVNSMVEAFLN